MRIVLLLCLLLASPTLWTCSSDTPKSPSHAPELPRAPREFRGVWVATVANIDWPSAPGLAPAQWREEASRILDRVAELRMNAVILQVRPQADALYPSSLEPWSYYLTGRQGLAPAEDFDPLAFWIDEAHRRGLELHAWFNPYRAQHPAMKGEASPDSIVRRRPELVVTLGDNGYRWMDPALEAVQDHSAAVVLDVVRRYDVDGVHFDDYFYPYRSYNDGEDFPDEASYAAYRTAGGELDRASFRRDAVDRFVARIHREVHAEKPHVKFGISPFGIWRPGHPRGIRGMDAYAELHADARLWLQEGWVDYLMPQLYWPIARVPQSFPLLLAWWQDQNPKGRLLWPGTMPRDPERESTATEMQNQVLVTRAMLRPSPGICFFSAKALLAEDAVIADGLRQVYAEDALVPSVPWLDEEAPPAPALQVHRADEGIRIWWQVAAEDIRHLVVYVRGDSGWRHRVHSASENPLRVRTDSGAGEILVSAVDRCGNEGPRVRVELPD